ncbi:DNA-binding response regulator [Marinomonas piezotolerans]|uniref:DNA-binding response regulator n=1 Tax=Marinomonas piezotolerans TaxID=2213058 RepID=A0A370UC04_9GAMM|nr:LytTR family DNA-binding domain-containing protein [Marinomonas piezotolerans]RDL45288.1 DNA-binding response regulator [Marinomonas piezotolerans]
MTQPKTAIIADDEPILRLTLKKLLAEVWSDLDIVAMASTGTEALELIAAAQPDIAFLDIRMPESSGLDVARQLQQQPELSPHTKIVFLTAFDEYALQAFDLAAVDYLLKPIDERRLEQTRDRFLQGAVSALDQQATLTKLERLLSEQVRPQTYSRWLNASKGDDIFVVDVNSVLYFQAGDKYITVITTEGEYLIRKSLRQLEEWLDPDQFWRVHRSILVQVNQIARVEKTFTGQLRIHLKYSDAIIPVSRRFSGRFKPA